MSKNPFIEYVKIWRKENPNVLYKDALKSAAVDYKKIAKPTNTEPKPKKQKTVEDKEVKNGRAKLIRTFKKLETMINSQLSSGTLNENTYDEFRKIGNVLRGNSLKNSYAKKLKDIDRKLKTKKYQKIASKIGKSEQNIQMKISSNKKITNDLQLEELNKEKATLKLRKEERKAKRKRALQQLKNSDGTRKYSDNQIDQMLKLEESGLSAKEAKSQTSAIGKYLEEDYLKEFLRINTLFTKANAKKYLMRNDSYRKDPYNVPIVSDEDELRNADKKPPVLPKPPKPPPPPPTFKLSASNNKIRDELFRDFGINDSQYKIDNLDDDLAKDLYFGEMNQSFSDREPLTTQAKIVKNQKKIKRLLNAYGTERGATYSRLQEIETLLDEYENGLVGFKATIKAEAKTEKDQVADLLEAIENTGVKITDKTKDTADDISTKKAKDLLDFIEGTGANVKTAVDKTANDKKIGEFVKEKMTSEVERLQRIKDKQKIEAEALVKREAEKQAKIKIEQDKALSNTARAKQLKIQAKEVEKQKKKEATELAKLEKANEKSLKLQAKKQAEADKTAKAIEQAQSKPIDLTKTKPKTKPIAKPKPKPPPLDLNDGGGGGGAKPVADKTAEITKEEFDKMKKHGASARIYVRKFQGKRDNEILDMVEREENGGKTITTVSSDNPEYTGKAPKAPTPPPSPILAKRNRETIENSIVDTEAKIKDLKKQLNMNSTYSQVFEDYANALFVGNVDNIDPIVQSVFEEYLNKGANLDSETEKVLTKSKTDGDQNTFRLALQTDPIGMNTVDTIAREILNNTFPVLYNELDTYEDTLTLLEAENDGYETSDSDEGGSLAVVKSHLKRANDYWNSGKMDEHANLVRKHLKTAKKILKLIPKNEVSDKVKNMVDYARSVIDPEKTGGALTNLAQPYTDANTG